MHYIKGKWYFISWMENDENYNPIWNVNPTVHHIRWSPAGILEGRPRKLSKNRIMALIESGQIIQHFCWVANWLVRKREQCLLVLISFYIPGFDPIETRHRTRHFVHESHIYSWVSLKPPNRIIHHEWALFSTPQLLIQNDIAGLTGSSPHSTTRPLSRWGSLLCWRRDYYKVLIPCFEGDDEKVEYSL